VSKKVSISKELFLQKPTLPLAAINMSAIFQGQTASNAIEVDSIPARRALPYGEEWRALKKGTELLAMKFPTASLKAGVKVIYESPKSQRGFPVVELEDVPKLDRVPPTDVVDRARASLNTAIDKAKRSAGSSGLPPWGVQIANLGFFSLAAVLFLPEVFTVKQFVERLGRILRWVDGEVIKHDALFAEWLRNILLNEPGIMQRNFLSTSDTQVNIRSLFYLVDESFVDDESVRTIMAHFKDYYGVDGRYLFIAPIDLENWRQHLDTDHEPFFPWNWEEEQMRSGKVEKVFVTVLLREHWGAICIDLRKRRILFGDSLGYKTPQDAMTAIWRWLNRVGQEIDSWDQSIGKFDVPQQPLTSGSCAINAANTIERTINPAVERWTHPRSSYFRVRAMKLLTAYSTVSLAVVLMTL
jgi:hypothetical protein